MSAIESFLAAVTSGRIGTADLWTADATFDATLPNWRMRVRGGAVIRAELAGWYADRGRFEELERIVIPDGELVQFLLTWTERGVPHAAHQAHVIRANDERISAHVVYCGGRWPAGLLAEMAEAAGG
jgi:hypothetical protein